MNNLHEICIIPIARLDGRNMTVLRKLKRQGAVPIGFGKDLSANSLAIATWLNKNGARSVEEHQIIPIDYVTSQQAEEMIAKLNKTGNYSVKYQSKLPLTSWRRVKISNQDYESLAGRKENVGLLLGDVWSELWQNENVGIGLPLALIWDILYDPAKQTVE